jgi:SAM-dependent methyltransferase
VTTDLAASLPMPPLDLLHRTGHMGDADPVAAYLENGRFLRGLIESFLPDDWSWSGKRVLDFGCGAGKVIRHFAAESADGEFWGCDIHGPSIDWMQSSLCPPFHAFECNEEPSLPQQNSYFDLIFAWSVYTHITDHWAGWLLEHHRTLADDGLLLASFLGEAMIEPLIGQQWDEDRIGMNALLAGHPWDLGGPIVFISPWWLRAHWGRAFEIVELRPYTGGNPPAGHGLVLLRRKPVKLTVDDLELIDPAEPREILALQHHIRQLRDETLDLRRAHADLAVQLHSAQLAAARSAEHEGASAPDARRATDSDPGLTGAGLWRRLRSRR